MKNPVRWLVLGLLAFVALPGYTAPITYTGALELRSPVWANQDILVRTPSGIVVGSRNFEPSVRYLDLAGHIRFTKKGSPLALFVNGQHSFSRGHFIHENEIQVGLDLKVKDTPLTLFSYFERRFDGDDLDRVFLGAKIGFSGRLD